MRVRPAPLEAGSAAFGWLMRVLSRCAPLFAVATVAAAEPLPVHLSSSLEPRNGRLPVFAVDGDEGTSFGTRTAPKPDDHFTITFDAPARLTTLSVLTGRTDERERLTDGALEISQDGTAFTELARLNDGTATAMAPDHAIKAVRLRVLGANSEPLTLCEFRAMETPFAPAGRVEVVRKLGSEFGEATIRFLGDASLLEGEEQKQLTAFLEKIGGIYGDKLAEMAKRLDSPWEQVPKTLFVSYKTDTGRGVPAYASGNSITLNTKWVWRQRDDSIGMFVHELSHVVQHYPRGNPGWLVEGISDLIRYELSPPEDAWVRRLEAIDPKKSDYKHAYSEAAKFLAWIQKTYAPELEGKLSRAMQEGKFRDALWAEITGKDLDTLWREYRGE